MNYIEKIKKVMDEIEILSSKLSYPITKDDYYIEDLGCPHKWSKDLPKDYAAVYFFAYNDEVLKIGKANSKSKSRFTSQHYRFNAPSTLAKSLYSDENFKGYFASKEDVKGWMLKNLRRINILIKASKGKAATELIESVLHYFFRPKYEGAI